jgi:hypothetical protein
MRYTSHVRHWLSNAIIQDMALPVISGIAPNSNSFQERILVTIVRMVTAGAVH